MQIIKWPPRRSSWISDRNDFSYFYLQVAQLLPTKFQVIWFLVQEKLRIDFPNVGSGGHLGFSIETI